ncbi:hypothetical protein BC937DRAFT_88735 [Endogone sp. FLAS-F59071]|nr:hypothetical protein BC937DRAFT_88735 [Endogone sp. FLAS-F59071]|eukprot:RUS18473.1 hypothetical protein BC937DRAFT_88735 [Endogone sp. FLAS-F59071]
MERRRTRKANESHIVTNSWSTDTPFLPHTAPGIYVSDSQKSHIAAESSLDNLSPTEISAESLHAHDASSLTLTRKQPITSNRPLAQVVPPKEHIQETIQVQGDISTLHGEGSSKLDASSNEKPNMADSPATRKANVTAVSADPADPADSPSIPTKQTVLQHDGSKILVREMPSPQTADRFPEASERSPTRNSVLSTLALGRVNDVNDLAVAEAGTAIAASGVMKEPNFAEKAVNGVEHSLSQKMSQTINQSKRSKQAAQIIVCSEEIESIATPVGEYGSLVLTRFLRYNNETTQHSDVEMAAAEDGCVQDDGDIADDEKSFEDPLNTQKKSEKKDNTVTGATHNSRSTAQEEVSRDDIGSSGIDGLVKARPIVIEPSFSETDPSNILPVTTNRDKPIEIAILSSASSSVDPSVTICIGSDQGHPEGLIQNLNIPIDTNIPLESHDNEEVATLDLNYFFKDEENYERAHKEVKHNLAADEEWNEAEDAHYLSLHYTQSQTETIPSHHATSSRRTTPADLSSLAIPETSNYPAARASSNSARGSYSASSGSLSKSINGEIADEVIVQQMPTPATTKYGTALGPRYKSLYEIGRMEKQTMGDGDADEDVTDFGKLLKRRRQKHDTGTERDMELEENDVLARPGYSRLIDTDAEKGDVRNQQGNLNNVRSRVSKRKRGSSQNIIVHESSSESQNSTYFNVGDENLQLTGKSPGLKRRRSGLYDQQEESSAFGAIAVNQEGASTPSKRLRRNDKRVISDTLPSDNGKRKGHVDTSSQRKACVERKFLESIEFPLTGVDESKRVSGNKRKRATMNGQKDGEEDLPKNRAATDRAKLEKKEKRNINIPEVEIEIPTYLQKYSPKRAKDNATRGTNMETTPNLSQVQLCANCGTTDSMLWNKNSNGDGIVCDDCGQKTFIVFSTMGMDSDNLQDDTEKSGDDGVHVPNKGRRSETHQLAADIGNATANHRDQVRVVNEEPSPSSSPLGSPTSSKYKRKDRAVIPASRIPAATSKWRLRSKSAAPASQQQIEMNVGNDTVSHFESRELIFAGIGFLITSNGQATLQEPKFGGYTAEQDLDQVMFDQAIIAEKIRKAGGTVFENISDAYEGRQRIAIQTTQAGSSRKVTPLASQKLVEPVRSIILIASKPKRTAKYLAALALGLPRVSMMFIQDCLDQNKLLDYHYYLLSNGFSAELCANTGSFGLRNQNILGENISEDLGIFAGLAMYVNGGAKKFTVYNYILIYRDGVRDQSRWRNRSAKNASRHRIVRASRLDHMRLCDLGKGANRENFGNDKEMYESVEQRRGRQVSTDFARGVGGAVFNKPKNR